MADVTTLLTDGTEVVLRPIGPDDKSLLEQGMAKLSATSRRLRFMSSIENLSKSQLAYLTEIDHHHHLAWGAMVSGQPVAVGRLVRLADPTESAEIAITVLDEWQGRGLGKLLVRLLAEIGRSVGIERVVFEALAENEGIVRLLSRFGAIYDLDEGVVTGSLEIGAIEAVPILAGDLLELAAAVRRPGSPTPAVAGQGSRTRSKRSTNSA